MTQGSAKNSFETIVHYPLSTMKSVCFLKLPADEQTGISLWLNLAAVRRIVREPRQLIVEYDDGSKQCFDGQQAAALTGAIDELSGTIDKSHF